MSKPNTAEPVKMFFSVLAVTAELLDETVSELSALYGQADFVSEQMSFDYTDYYNPEMGETLVRRFLSMEKLIRPDTLPDIKLATNVIEQKSALNGSRQVNIDPGYLAKAQLILATGKGFAHRPYLRDGIYADLTLVYQGKKFCSLPWTYPDYADERQLSMLIRIREKYLSQLRKSGE